MAYKHVMKINLSIENCQYNTKPDDSLSVN